ncbi:SIR2 family protein [Hydrogenophilus thiooxidans]|uniref:SIR2 family protein n=1 Tax=Hydrogenophilus thiooxidans TaxID=2820326 RepID=UPI001C211D40|nr:SIR2 family protein [Hydrogenophilus thiooxidans]
MSLQNGQQIIKTRDDPERLTLAPIPPANDRFKLAEGVSCSWAKADEEFGPEKLRERIEPWLTALCQSEHLSLLVGSGLTHAVHRLATGASLPGMNTVDFKTLGDVIKAEVKRTAKELERGEGNIEDQIRVVNELLRGLQILAATKAKDAQERKHVEDLRRELSEALQSFAASILQGENNLASAPDDKREHAFTYLVSFLMTFASRSGTRDRLHLFTTNYDRYIEIGADVAGLRLVDRFVGTLAPIFRASRLDVDLHYNPPGIRGEPRYLEGVARFTKLHGSVDWVHCNGEIRRIGLPFGADDIDPYLKAPGLKSATALQLMIYPNPAKDVETLFYPYSELFRDFAAAICRPNSTLFCYGYSFGDEHINRIIEDMLTIPSAHLVIISYSDPLGRIMRTYERLGRGAQVTLLLGDHLGDLKTLVDHYLPKPAIDRTTIRMADLIKARLGAQVQVSQAPTPENEGGALS